MPDRRLPVADATTQPFWDSCRQHAMQLQQCDHCEHWIFYPRTLCPHCFGVDLTWKAVSGRGTVYSYIICHTPGPGFNGDDCPYVSAIVELEEGCRLHTNLVGVEPSPDTVRIGMRVQVAYEDHGDDITLPLFRPA